MNISINIYFYSVLQVIAFLVITSWIINASPLGRDDSDKQGWFVARSGVKIVTDELSGCQYLSTSNGGITPRLNLDGSIVGCKK